MFIILRVLIFFTYVSIAIPSSAADRLSPAAKFVIQNYDDDAQKAHSAAQGYLQKAQTLLKKHDGALPLSASDTLTLRTSINTLHLIAARTIVDCMMPNMSIVKYIFDQSTIYKHLNITWNAPVTGPIPIEICEKYEGIAQVRYHMTSVAGLLQINAIKIEISPVWTQGGNILLDADILEGLMAHEMHHIIAHDGLWRAISQRYLSPMQRIAQVQEIEADVFACHYSERSARGLVRFCAIDCEVEQQGFTYKQTVHLKPKNRLELAQKYVQKIYSKQYNTLEDDVKPFVSYQVNILRRRQFQQQLFSVTKSLIMGCALGMILGQGINFSGIVCI